MRIVGFITSRQGDVLHKFTYIDFFMESRANDFFARANLEFYKRTSEVKFPIGECEKRSCNFP